MEFEAARKAITSTELFRDLDPGDLWTILLGARVVSCAAREVLFRKGEEAGQNLYLIVSGTLRVLFEESRETELERKCGSILGESGLVNPHHVRTRTVASGPPSELLVWNIGEWDGPLAAKVWPRIEESAFEHLAARME